jgi:hypothetical protein
MGYRGELVPGIEEDGPASEEEFDRLVEDAVKRVLDRRAREAQPPPEKKPSRDPKPRERTAAAETEPDEEHDGDDD